MAVGTIALALVGFSMGQTQGEEAEEPGGAGAGRWVGLMFVPLSDQARAHVKVPEGQGLVVAEVVPDSPAAQAGLERHDIVVAVDTTPARSVEDVKRVIDESAEGAAIQLEIIHKGKPKSVAVTPQQAPVDLPAHPRIGPAARPGVEPLRRWVEQLEREGMVRAPLNLRLFDRTAVDPLELPENLEVRITRKGGQPAQIVVKQNDKTWEVTEDQLGELPEEIRPHVEQMLGMNFTIAAPERWGRFRPGPDGLEGGPDGFEGFPAPGERPGPPAVQHQLEEMEQRIQRMLQELRELRREGRPEGRQPRGAEGNRTET